MPLLLRLLALLLLLLVVSSLLRIRAQRRGPIAVSERVWLLRSAMMRRSAFATSLPEHSEAKSFLENQMLCRRSSIPGSS